jgi:hypothetical protein
LIKFATRIPPAFMYLTDFRENTLQNVITKLEPELFLAVTGLCVKYEDASLRYTGIESHPGLTHYGLYDTVVAKD